MSHSPVVHTEHLAENHAATAPMDGAQGQASNRNAQPSKERQ